MLPILLRSVVILSSVSFVAAGLVAGCGAEPADPVGPTGGATPGSGGGGAGAEGGSGGSGASGGDDLCAQDCSTVSPPPCHVSVCNDGSHAGAVGQCVVVAAEDGTVCDDGKFCTAGDSCQGGVCVGGPPNDCGMTPEECQEVVCDESNKVCGFDAVPNGEPCISDDLCLSGSACQGGVCAGGTVKDCFFAPVPNDCHIPVCNPVNGMCEPVPGNDGGACTDASDLCTVQKTCAAGQCGGGVPKDCSHLTSGCNMGVCEATTGQCTTSAVGEGQLCDDLNACTTGETCSSGVCGMGTPVTTCSQVADGCCPANCTELDDLDCACPGEIVNGNCVYLASPNAFNKAGALAQCQSLGANWDLCTPAILCDPLTKTYLGAAGCDCNGGATACACGSAKNLYFYVTTAAQPYYIRTSLVPNCDWAGDQCTTGSASCGAALCCKPFP